MDLVERLRGIAAYDGTWQNELREAADEIERLLESRENMRVDLVDLYNSRAKLRAALETIRDGAPPGDSAWEIANEAL